ncbi:fimbrial protein [Salmonella enterica]|nr:fimbrial protein [Salmonella enterica]
MAGPFTSPALSPPPCSITGDTNLTVPFGVVSSRELSAADKFTPSVPVVIHLTGCSFDADTTPTPGSSGKFSKVSVGFRGQSNTDNKSFRNLGDAPNVGIQLLQGDNSTLIVPNAPADTTKAQQLVAGANQLNFFARLLAFVFHWYEPHMRTTNSFTDSLSIGCIVLP